MNSDEQKGRSDDSATTMFAKYKQPDSGQVLSNLVGWGGLCGGRTRQLTHTLADTG